MLFVVPLFAPIDLSQSFFSMYVGAANRQSEQNKWIFDNTNAKCLSRHHDRSYSLQKRSTIKTFHYTVKALVLTINFVKIIHYFLVHGLRLKIWSAWTLVAVASKPLSRRAEDCHFWQRSCAHVRGFGAICDVTRGRKMRYYIKQRKCNFPDFRRRNLAGFQIYCLKTGDIFTLDTNKRLILLKWEKRYIAWSVVTAIPKLVVFIAKCRDHDPWDGSEAQSFRISSL